VTPYRSSRKASAFPESLSGKIQNPGFRGHSDLTSS
jgi:hypothetical protein